MGHAAINNSDVVDERCHACFRRVYTVLLEKFQVDVSQAEVFLTELETVVSRSTQSSPEIQRELSKRFAEMFGKTDPFAEEKEISNRTALKLYKQWKPKVVASEKPVDLALRLAIAGNIMDYGASRSFNIHHTIQQVLSAQFAIDHSELLIKKIANATQILYLGDNAGEIVFDRLFIETMGAKHVVFAVKSGPVLNDVTVHDAKESAITNVATVISNGFDAPSTVLSRCSNQFLEIYRKADVIISKGQGNFEGLIDERDERLFYLMMVKCDAIAEKLQMPVKSFVVMNSNRR